jgi:hypothetical protein
MKIARNIVAGALSGLGVIVLLQQYAVAYPTAITTIFGVVVGIAVQFGIAHLVTRRNLATAGGAVPIEDAMAPATYGDVAVWAPTHCAPATGLDAWADSDGANAPVARLDPGLAVEVIDRRGDWAHISCENGWTAWVDGRQLELRP